MTNAWSLLYDTMTEHSKHYYEYDRNDPQRTSENLGITSSTKKDYNDFWELDGISLTGNPIASPDTITFSSTNYGAAQPVPFPGGAGQDVITFGSSSADTITFGNDHIELNIPDLPETNNNNGRWKYDEDVIISDITDYVGGTYRSHYTGAANGFKEIQTIDLMAAKGLASSFCQANILKYGSRYGAKDGKSKRDLLKVIHYAMLLLHFDNHYKESDYPF